MQDRLDYAKLLQEKEAQDILDWVNGPSLGIVALESSSDINSSWPDATVGSAAIGSTAEPAAEGGGQAVPSQSKTQKGAWGKGSSFANITQVLHRFIAS